MKEGICSTRILMIKFTVPTCRQKNPAPPPNKRFLRNMLVSTLRDNRPLSPKPKFNRSHQQKRHDTSPKRSSDSDTYFRYNDKYRQSVDGQMRDGTSGTSYDRHSCPESRQQLYGPEKTLDRASLCFRNSKDDDLITDTHHKGRNCEKRLRDSSSDSDEEKRNRGEKEKDRHRKRRKKLSKRDNEDVSTRRKQKKSKKSKKSKKHKAKKSHHSTKDSL